MSRFIELFNKKYALLLILFFPLLYFIAGIYFRLILDAPSLRSIDPDYVYFISGLNISEGYLKVKHIDHPGTPLQYLVAVVFRIIWLFRRNPSGFVEDVLSHPDLYLSIVNLVITALISISLFITGKFIYKKNGSVVYALLIQTLPFISVILYEIIGRITPELLLPVPLLALSAFLIYYISSGNEKLKNNDLLFLSLIMAFGLSLKLTLLPFWIIPLIIVRPWKAKLFVLAASIFFFLIIAFPVTLQLEQFWNWTKALIFHSGQYGSGEENIVNLVELRTNLLQIFHLQKYLSFLIIALILLLPPTIFQLKKTQNPKGKKLISTVIAIVLVVLLQAFISGKHYAPRYFLPALMMGPLIIFLLAEIVKIIYPSKTINVIMLSGITFFLIFNTKQQIGVINYTSEAFEKQIEARKLTRSIADTFEKESIKIIVSQDYGCPFIEYALHFSTVWSAPRLRENYIKKLATLYPNTYQYTTWDGNFIFWGAPLNPEKIIDEKIPVYMYLEKNTDELYNRTIKKLEETAKGFYVDKKLLFENSLNGEGLLQLHFSKLSSNPDKIVQSQPEI